MSLRFPRPRHAGSRRALPRGETIPIRQEILGFPAETPPRLVNGRDLFILHLHERAGRAAAAGLWWRFHICGQVEADEEEKVTAQDSHAGECGKLLAGTSAVVRHPGEVGGSEVGVGAEVDEAEVDDELSDLEDRNVLFPPDADAACGLEVVPVHDHVDKEVEGDGDPGDCGVASELAEAEESGGAVVVRVEEGKGFLLEDEEDSVDEFEVFGQVVELWTIWSAEEEP